MSNELDEKFVSDDGISSVEGPVTPEGGTIKDKKADLKKKVDPVADTVDDAPVSESFEAIFEGMDLSEDFKDKLSLVFEAAVNEAAAAKAAEAIESVEEDFQTQLQESIDESMESIIENLDNYLDYVVQEWMEENTVAIEAGIKVEMAESLMVGLKDLFYEHNLEIEEETIDVVAALEEDYASLESKTNAVINDNIELTEELALLRADKVFTELAEGLTATQVERLRVLSEKLDHSDLDSFATDLETLKESFFKKAPVITEDLDDEQEILTEDTSTTQRVSSYDSVNAIANFLNARK